MYTSHTSTYTYIYIYIFLSLSHTCANRHAHDLTIFPHSRQHLADRSTRHASLTHCSTPHIRYNTCSHFVQGLKTRIMNFSVPRECRRRIDIDNSHGRFHTFILYCVYIGILHSRFYINYWLTDHFNFISFFVCLLIFDM